MHRYALRQAHGGVASRKTASALILLAFVSSLLFPRALVALPETSPQHYIAPAPGTPWTPPTNLPAGLPKDYSAFEGNAMDTAGKRFTLTELIDIALSINPLTRGAWAQALAAAANWGAARSGYYPTIQGSAQANIGNVPVALGGESYGTLTTSLSYLLLDFGGRNAQAEAARQALIAADFSHNQAISDLLRNVPQAFYALQAKQAQVRASEKALTEARESLAAAKMRLTNGIGTISDVLQAQSAEQQAILQLTSDRGAAEIAHGSLATTIGWPANQRFEIAGELREPPLKLLATNVDDLVDRARRNRPDLNAAIAQLKQQEAQVKQARALPFPQLTAGANAIWQGTRHADDTGAYGTMQMSIPIFNGFSHQNQLRAARAQAEAARANLKVSEETVISDVWNGYQNFRTSREQVTAARSLLSSAEESFAASLARFKEGATTIVELLNAQTTLASARAQLISARMNLSSSYAELMHAVGSLASPDNREDTSTEAVNVSTQEQSDATQGGSDAKQ